MRFAEGDIERETETYDVCTSKREIDRRTVGGWHLYVHNVRKAFTKAQAISHRFPHGSAHLFWTTAESKPPDEVPEAWRCVLS